MPRLSQFTSTSSRPAPPRRTPPSQANLDSIDQPQRSVNHPVVSLQLPLINDCGIRNGANACYINATLQALLRTCRAFTASVFSQAMSIENPLLSSLRLLALGMSHPHARLSHNLPTLLDIPNADYWSGVEKRDAGEFLTEGLFRSLSVDSSLDLSSFTGQYAVRETCDCGHVLQSTEDFQSITVLPQEELKEAIKFSVGSTDRNRREFACPMGDSHQHTFSTKSRSLSTMPDSLVVIIDRRSQNVNTVSSVQVVIPNQFSSGGVQYRVSSSVEWYPKDGGHFVCKVRNTIFGDTWTTFDDGSLPDKSKTVNGGAACVLFCQKVSSLSRDPLSVPLPADLAELYRQPVWGIVPQEPPVPELPLPTVPIGRKRNRAQALEPPTSVLRPRRTVKPPTRFEDFVPTEPRRAPRNKKLAPVVLGEAVVDLLASEQFSEMLPRYHDELRELIGDVKACPVCREVRSNLEIADIIYPESVPLNERTYSQACARCRAELKKSKSLPFMFSKENNMIPLPPPDALKHLTPIEQALIARISPVMAVYNLRHGSSAARGHVVAVPVDIDPLVMALSLPRTEVDIVVVSREMFDGTIREFHVRRHVVHQALLWLIEHNEYYKDVKINKRALEDLPLDGPYESLKIYKDKVPDADANVIVEDSGAGFTSSGYRHVVCLQSEKDKVRLSLQQKKPLRLTDTPGLLTKAFPVLYPDGAGDFTDKSKMQKCVTLQAYLQHLQSLEHQGLANDRRLPYFLFNTYFRERLASTAKVYVDKNVDVQAVSIAELKEAFNEDQTHATGTDSEKFRKIKALLKNANSWTGALPGTPAYWKGVCSKLTAMIRQLHCPHLFCTQSFADFHCPDLREHLERRLGISIPPEEQRRVVLENPGLVDHFLYRKFELIFKHYYQDVVGVQDHYYRVEYQGRGAIHVHCMFWLSATLNFGDAQCIKNVVDSLISTMHPDPDNQHDDGQGHPCKQHIDYTNLMANGLADARDYVNRIVHQVQRHACQPGYCVKSKTACDCRFGFPKENAPETTVTAKQDGTFEIITARNHPRINNYSSCLALLTRSNHDIQIITSLEAAIGYVGKYTSKPEFKSASFREMIKTYLEKCSEGEVDKLFRLLMNGSLANRDWSQQEVYHISAGLPLCVFSRTFVTISASESFAVDNEECRLVSSMEKYLHRANQSDPDGIEDDVSRRSMWGLNKFFIASKQGNKWKRADVDRIVLARPYFPKFVNDKLNENWCRVHLTFHKVYSSREAILGSHETFLDAYNEWIELPSDDPLKDPKYAPQTYDDWPKPPKVKRDKTCVQDPNRVLLSPNGGYALEERLTASLGNALLDIDNDMTPPEDCASHVLDFVPAPKILAFADSVLLQAPGFYNDSITTGLSSANAAPKIPSVIPLVDRVSQLTENQRALYTCVKTHFESTVTPIDPLRIIVHGTAGTGKSFVIAALVDLLGEACATIAPTGVAASNIDGRTIHSFANLKPGHPFVIPDNQLKSLQEKHERVRYVIIDEISMVGCKLFAQCSQRLNQIFPSEGIFGNRSVILFGDFGQLPPVADSPLFQAGQRKSEIAQVGRSAYGMFNRGVVLDQVMRQAVSEGAPEEESREAQRFMKLLLAVRCGNLDKEDYSFLCLRASETIEPPLVPDVVYLFGTNAAAHAHNKAVYRNFEKIADLPRLHFLARTDNPLHNKTGSDKAGGLMPELTLIVGARVMLTANVNVANNLVNGSIGVVTGFGPCDESGMPTVVMVKFDGYRGPLQKDGHGCVGIVPVKRTWTCGKFTITRTMIPLRLAWGITVHKSQGLTLPCVVVDLKSFKISKLRLAFVAFSRVKKFRNLYYMAGELGVQQWMRQALLEKGAKRFAKNIGIEEDRIRLLGLQQP